MSVFGIFVQYEYNGPTYTVGIFSTKEEAELKMESQYDWDVENGEDSMGVDMYFVTEIPYNTASYEREDKSLIELKPEPKPYKPLSLLSCMK